MGGKGDIYDNNIMLVVFFTNVLNKALSNVSRVISVFFQCLAEYTTFSADIQNCELVHVIS